jgi:hypothetical protein
MLTRESAVLNAVSVQAPGQSKRASRRRQSPLLQGSVEAAEPMPTEPTTAAGRESLLATRSLPMPHEQTGAGLPVVVAMAPASEEGIGRRIRWRQGARG